MSDLRPTLWRTCRVIACETRLKLLWALFREEELCVSSAAECVGMGDAQASIQLRSLNARGLISSRRKKMRVFYRPEANVAVDFAPQLLGGLHACYVRRMAHAAVIRQATAFTHERRIEVVRALDCAPMDWNDLVAITGMSDTALFSHLGKLRNRGLVKKGGDRYMLSWPENRFGALLLRVALS